MVACTAATSEDAAGSDARGQPRPARGFPSPAPRPARAPIRPAGPARWALRSARLSSASAHCRASARLSARSPGLTVRLGFIAISTAPKRRPAIASGISARAGPPSFSSVNSGAVSRRRRRGPPPGPPAAASSSQLTTWSMIVPRSSSPASWSASASRRPSHSPSASAGAAAAPRGFRRRSPPVTPVDFVAAMLLLGLRCRCMRPRRAYRLTALKKEASAPQIRARRFG